MRGHRLAACFAMCLALPLLTIACGGSGGVTEPDETSGSSSGGSGSAIVQGTVTAGSTAEGIRVSVVGTRVTGSVDMEGQFALTSVPAGKITLRFEGDGTDAKVTVEGLQNGQVTSVVVELTKTTATLAEPPTCAPQKETFISGKLEQMSGTRLVVAGIVVDASSTRKVWRGETRIQLEQLIVGEKVKVWGVLKGDGTIVSEEIAALSNGEETWITLSGIVESVSYSSRGGIHFDPNVGCAGSFRETANGEGLHANPGTGGYPTIVVQGKTIRTSSATKFRYGNGNDMDPSCIKAGQTAYVEGWVKTDSTVRSTLVRIDKW